MTAAAIDDILDAVREAALSDEFILKSRVAAFETATARETGFAHAIACAGVQGAVTLALPALGIAPGDEVILPAFGDPGAASAVALSRATPVFADVDEVRGTLSPRYATVATGRTRAVVAAPGDTDLYAAVLAAGHPLIEVQHGWYCAADRPAAPPPGTVRVVAVGPGSVLGGIGDGAVLVTDDAERATALRMLRNHGQDLNVRFYHPRVGFNCRMDESNAAFLLRRIATVGAVPVPARADAVPGGHLAFGGLPIRFDPADRSECERYASARPARMLLLSAQPAYASAAGSFPAAEHFSRTLAVLPLSGGPA